MAGTGNDYIGKLNVTRSNRTCQFWIDNTAKKNNTNSTLKTNSATKTNLTIKRNSHLKRSTNVKISTEKTTPLILKGFRKRFLGLISKKEKVFHRHPVKKKYLNDSLYADTNALDAQNYCRNPSRDIAGSYYQHFF